jgi:uncharacterized protein DUF6011
MPKILQSNYPGFCRTCKQHFPAGTMIQWLGPGNSAHANLEECGVPAQAASQAKPVAPPAKLPVPKIVEFLQGAQAKGLKQPRVRFLAPQGLGKEMRLSLASANSQHPGSVQVKIDWQWLGQILPDGTVRNTGGLTQAVLDTIATIAEDPAAAAKAYGALMRRCSFCNIPLTDAGSVEVGYGPICAYNYDLPHTPLGTPAVAEVPITEQAPPVPPPAFAPAPVAQPLPLQAVPTKSTEASSLGISAGSKSWPLVIEFEGTRYSGPVPKVEDGELVSVHYTSHEGFVLIVFND